MLFDRQYGDGDQVLIILHGLLGSSANWQSLAKRFAQTNHVYALDLRNHGQSPWSDSMDYASMAEDVLAFIGNIKAASITVLGHSMGGKVAMQLALKYPHVINKLIVADIAPVAYHHDFSPLLNAMQSLNLASLKKRTQADSELSTQIADPAVRAFLLHNLAFFDGRWFWRPNLEVLLKKQTNILAFDAIQTNNFTQNTLFIHGQNSDYVQTKYYPIINQLFPKYQVETIANAGHWLHAEQPKVFYQACIKFLQD